MSKAAYNITLKGCVGSSRATSRPITAAFNNRGNVKRLFHEEERDELMLHFLLGTLECNLLNKCNDKVVLFENSS